MRGKVLLESDRMARPGTLSTDCCGVTIHALYQVPKLPWEQQVDENLCMLCHYLRTVYYCNQTGALTKAIAGFCGPALIGEELVSVVGKDPHSLRVPGVAHALRLVSGEMCCQLSSAPRCCSQH